jgi:hypothetical protein
MYWLCWGLVWSGRQCGCLLDRVVWGWDAGWAMSVWVLASARRLHGVVDCFGVVGCVAAAGLFGGFVVEEIDC